MHILTGLYGLLDEQLEEIVRKGDITPSELECAYKAVDIMKDIETIKAMKGEGYSERMSYNDYSGARMRDSRGRYTSRDDMYNSRNSYNYSGHGLKEKFQNMMRETQNDEERQKLQRFMQEL
ncbi:MAG: hypothetical protein IJH36_03120 [Clostridia bacterium]|nr:hypothetical protein [Clostridia bacterium]MBQ3462093.1 hypothetical protein [Clostridia bacterium]MBQ3471085.1 hypothetical protein [Clostridia bacterium]MBQ9599419.1 hypothetical protein [Clostridia bacterium]MBR0470993.1 hypothetical protein [Clostridia bacterium]